MEKQKITIVEARLFRCICTRRWAKSRRRFIEKPSLVHGPIQITILNSRQPLGLANLNVMRTFIVITMGQRCSRKRNRNRERIIELCSFHGCSRINPAYPPLTTVFQTSRNNPLSGPPVQFFDEKSEQTTTKHRSCR